MREEIRPINRLFVRYWMTEKVLPHIEYTINYSAQGYFKYNFLNQ